MQKVYYFALDASGSPSAGMRYEPYGQPVDTWGKPPALGFTGEWTDSSGLLYLRARYMDPSSATFLSRDPFEGLPTRVLSRNGYSWVEGNPINLIDPSGEFAIPVVGAALAMMLLASMVMKYGQNAISDFFDAAGAGLSVCLPAITNLVNSVNREIFGPSPQKILGDRFGISPNGRGNPGFADHSDLRLSILSNPASSLQVSGWLEGYADHSDLRLSILSNPGSSSDTISILYAGKTDIKQVVASGRQAGIDVNNRNCRIAWGRFIEDTKRNGERGSHNQRGDFHIP